MKDWRVLLIVGVTVVCIVATLIIWLLGYGRDPITPFGAIFAAWVAGLALFVITGILVTVVSLARPEQESFDARARILFRQQSGKHIDFIIKRIAGALAHYNESTFIKVIVADHNVIEKKLLIVCESKTLVRAYVDDITSTVISRIKLRKVTAAPPSGVSNRIVFLRLCGVNMPTLTRDFNLEIDLPYNITIEPHTSCEVERCSQIWTIANEETNTHTPVRYTKRLTLTFENRLPPGTIVRIFLSTNSGSSWQEHDLTSGDSKELLQSNDAEPDKEIYRYRATTL